MSILRRIHPASAFKIGLILHGAAGLAFGALCTFMAMVGPRFLPPSRLHHVYGAGIMSIIVCPIVWGLVGGMVAAMGAAIYNAASGWIGGLEVDLG